MVTRLEPEADEELDELVYLHEQFLKNRPTPTVRLIGSSNNNGINPTQVREGPKLDTVSQPTKPKSLFVQRREAARAGGPPPTESKNNPVRETVPIPSFTRGQTQPLSKVISTQQVKKGLPQPNPLSSIASKRTQYQVPLDPTTASETTVEVLDAIKTKYFGNLPTEPEKLKWMISKPSTSEDKQKLRFDFNGVPLTSNSDISSFTGLYHHGEDPNQAGYSLQEIVLLIRSSLAGQRVVALTILHKIFFNIRQGKFNNQRCQYIIQMLVEMDLAASVKWCLDLKSFSVIVAAITVIHTWLHITPMNPVDYDHLNPDWFCKEVSGYHLGYKQVSHAATSSSNLSEYETEETSELDPKVLNYDTTYGFVYLGLLAELQTLLVSHRHQSQLVLLMLEIIQQLGHHSLAGAEEVMKTPRLLKTIYTQFIQLPIGNTSPSLAEMPVFSTTHAALLVLRTILQASKGLAQDVLRSGYVEGIFDVFKALMTDHQPFSPIEIGLLQADILSCLQILASYGLYRYDPMLLIKQLVITTDPTHQIRATASYRFLETYTAHQFGLAQLPLLRECSQWIISQCQDSMTIAPTTSLDKLAWSSLMDAMCIMDMLLKSEPVTEDLVSSWECRITQPSLISSLQQTTTSLQQAFPSLLETPGSAEDVASYYWNSAFRRIFPSLVSPFYHHRWQMVHSQCLPDLGVMRSILEWVRYLGFRLTDSEYQTVAGTIMQLLELVSEFPPPLIQSCQPISNLIFTWLQLEPASGLESNSLQLVSRWYLIYFPDMMDQLDSTVLLRLGLPVGGMDIIHDDPGFLIGHPTQWNLYNQGTSYELVGLDTILIQHVFQPRAKVLAQIKGLLGLTRFKYQYIASTCLSPSLLRTLTNNLHLGADRVQLLKLIRLDINLLFDTDLLATLDDIVKASVTIESKLRKHLHYPQHALQHLELGQYEKTMVFAYYLDTVKDLMDHYLNTGFHHPVFLPILISLLSMDTLPSEFRIVIWGSILTSLSPTSLSRFRFSSIPSHYLSPLETSKVVLEHQADLILSRFITPTTNSFLYDIASHHLRENLVGKYGHLSKDKNQKLREFFQLAGSM